MKEKTFNELMHEYTVKLDGVTTYYLQPKTVLKLLQQVREATIAECLGALNGYDYDERIKTEFETMKTDRIKLTENK